MHVVDGDYFISLANNKFRNLSSSLQFSARRDKILFDIKTQHKQRAWSFLTEIVEQLRPVYLQVSFPFKLIRHRVCQLCHQKMWKKKRFWKRTWSRIWHYLSHLQSAWRVSVWKKILVNVFFNSNCFQFRCLDKIKIYSAFCMSVVVMYLCTGLFVGFESPTIFLFHGIHTSSTGRGWSMRRDFSFSQLHNVVVRFFCLWSKVWFYYIQSFSERAPSSRQKIICWQCIPFWQLNHPQNSWRYEKLIYRLSWHENLQCSLKVICISIKLPETNLSVTSSFFFIGITIRCIGNQITWTAVLSELTNFRYLMTDFLFYQNFFRLSCVYFKSYFKLFDQSSKFKNYYFFPFSTTGSKHVLFLTLVSIFGVQFCDAINWQENKSSNNDSIFHVWCSLWVFSVLFSYSEAVEPLPGST